MNSLPLDSSESFPSKAILWPGCLLASIAHAIFVTGAAFMANEQSWDGRNYSVQNSAGSRGTIAFGPEQNSFVGVFYLDTSGRNGSLQATPDARGEIPLLRDVSDRLRPLSREATQYVLQDVDGKATPIVTAAFWSEEGTPFITSSEPWSEVVRHGAVLVRNQTLSPDVALLQWSRDFEFSSAQTDLTESLFKRRIGATGQRIHLTAAETQLIRETSEGEDGFRASRESFSEIGILVPD